MSGPKHNGFDASGDGRGYAMRRVRLAGLVALGAGAALALSLVVPAARSQTRPTLPTTLAAERTAGTFGFDQAFVIPITDEINDVTLDSLERRLDHAREQHADLIVLEMDTPGGVAFTALEMCTKIKNLRDVHTVAWVNPDAYSAGAIIALACDEIVMSPRSKIGDCQPIMIGPEGVSAVPDEVSAKFTSPLLEELRDSASRGGYDPLLCLAMVRPQMEVFWVENTETGERRFVEGFQRDRLFGLAEGGAEAEDKGADDKDKERGESDRARTRKRREPIPDSLSQTAWRYVTEAPPLGVIRQPVVPGDELLTMGQDAAIAYGFAKAKVGSLNELRDFFGIRGPIGVLPYTWSETLVDWLSSPLVRSVLFILMMLGAYVEFNTPGIGVAGIVALACLLIFLGAPYLTGLADAWEILVVVVGIALLLVEVFVIPGFGIAGVTGIVLIVVGLLATFMPEDPGPIYWPSFEYTVEGLKKGLWVLAGGLTGSLAGMWALSHVLPKSPYFSKIVPANPTAESVTVGDPYGGMARIGDIGQAVADLRPAGKARFGSTLVDVVSDGEYIESGERIVVSDHRGNRVVVRRIRGDT